MSASLTMSIFSLPRIVDAHSHFIDPANNSFQSFIRSLGVASYLPERYEADKSSLPITDSVHIEAMPDDGVAEVGWIESLIDQGQCRISAIIANCHLAGENAEECLKELKHASPNRLRGVRQILDYNGSFDKNKLNGTHVACSRHGLDYLRDPTALIKFERGFSFLKDQNLSFELQCAPEQLLAAADIFKRHPDVPVCVNHMGKLRYLEVNVIKDENGLELGYTLAEDASKHLLLWSLGMKKLAELPHVFVKLSMLGYAVPGWYQSPAKTSCVKKIILEVIALFGAHRCMFGSNFHINGSISDSDGIYREGPSLEELYQYFFDLVCNDLCPNDLSHLFYETAMNFYSIDKK